jgi:hypothetical protein
MCKNDDIYDKFEEYPSNDQRAAIVEVRLGNEAV